MAIFDFQRTGSELNVVVNATKFDITMAQDFRRAMESQWTPDTSSVVVDFSRVDFIDSSGVGALVSVHKRFTSPEHRVTLLNASPSVVAIIEMLRLHRVFHVIKRA